MGKSAYLIAGLAFGDESKGATTEWHVRKHGASLVVRHCGGHQAAHNIVLKDGRHHMFSQFGSGSFVPAVKTHLSRFMLVNPIAQMKEEEHLRSLGVADMWDRTTIDKKCIVVTPFHKAINRLAEDLRGDERHGSCGVGIGAARCAHLNYGDQVLLAGDLRDQNAIFKKLRFLQNNFVEEHDRLLESKGLLNSEYRHPEQDILYSEDALYEIMDGYLRWPGKVVDGFTPEDCMVFEGSQGVLLDETHGTLPYATWTNTTFENALILLDESGFTGQVTKVGCLRTYFTRHGAGPFPTEGKVKGVTPFVERHNAHGVYQGCWRVGSFDFDLANYALEVCGGVNYLSISHCDIVDADFAHFERMTGVRVGLAAYGPTFEDRREIV